MPEWADRERVLAKEAGSTGGRWSTATVEIARGPMLAVTEPGVRTITAMTCTQLLKTSLLESVFGFHAHLDPGPILLLQPKDEAAEQFSKERIAPMVRVTPVLRKLVGTTKTRDSSETLTFKTFPGGFLALAGAGSPDNLARRPIRVLLADEIDKYPVTREGDPILLAEERMATFAMNSLSVRACSPTVEDESRIAASYAASDQRRASMACPHCGHRMFPDFFRHVQWDKDGARHFPETARIYCEACGVGWSEGERLLALATIRWHQTKPFECCGARHSPLDAYGASGNVDEVWDWWASDRHAVYRAKCPTCGKWAVDNQHAGFQASKLYSPWQKDRPADIARKYLGAKDDEHSKQAWWNTQMGLPYRPNSGKELRVASLIARLESWEAEVPDEVGVLTAGVDVQGDRLEVELVGWGRNEESWSLDHHVIEGDPDGVEVWEALDRYLLAPRMRGDGREFKVLAACVDSGGTSTQAVYEYCKARIGRKVWAIKGESARTGQRSPVWPTKRPSRRSKASYRPIILGVNAAKDTIRSRLHIELPGPGYMHFPADRDTAYFEQLTSERSVVKTAAGQRFRVWELPRGRANEALDCRVYAYGALCGLLHFGLKLNKRVDDVVATIGPRLADLPAPAALEPPSQPAGDRRPVESGRSLIDRLA